MITCRGDNVTITASISFSKKDTQKENWPETKTRLIAAVEPSFRSQLKEVENRAEHEAEVRERIRPTQ